MLTHVLAHPPFPFLVTAPRHAATRRANKNRPLRSAKVCWSGRAAQYVLEAVIGNLVVRLPGVLHQLAHLRERELTPLIVAGWHKVEEAPHNVRPQMGEAERLPEGDRRDHHLQEMDAWCGQSQRYRELMGIGRDERDGALVCPAVHRDTAEEGPLNQRQLLHETRQAHHTFGCCTPCTTVCSAPSRGPPNATRQRLPPGGKSVSRPWKKSDRRRTHHRLGRSIRLRPAADGRAHLGALAAHAHPARAADP